MTDAPLFTSARPYTRWWWFSGPIDEAVIRHQLDWAAANGFGRIVVGQGGILEVAEAAAAV